MESSEIKTLSKRHRRNLHILLLFCFFTSIAPAEENKSANAANAETIDLQNLEDKYWSAKDDNYGVIQNRTFSKEKKFYGSLFYGPLINDPFAKARASGFSGGYFFTEDLGIEISQLSYNSTQNGVVSAYESQFGGAKPDYNLLKATHSLSLIYSPFYAKMSLMNKSIMYFDLGFYVGVGQSLYEIQKVSKDNAGNKSTANEQMSATHYEIGIMQQLFVSKHWAVRLDIKNTFYSQETQRYEISIGAAESSRPKSSKDVNDTTVLLGLTFFTN